MRNLGGRKQALFSFPNEVTVSRSFQPSLLEAPVTLSDPKIDRQSPKIQNWLGNDYEVTFCDSVCFEPKGTLGCHINTHILYLSCCFTEVHSQNRMCQHTSTCSTHTHTHTSANVQLVYTNGMEFPNLMLFLDHIRLLHCVDIHYQHNVSLQAVT